MDFAVQVRTEHPSTAVTAPLCKCGCGNPVEKRPYETASQWRKREAKGIYRAKCAKNLPPVVRDRPHSTLSLLHPPNYKVEDKEPNWKEKTWRSESYLDFIRSLPSVVSANVGCCAHHVGKKGQKGVACKVGDDRAVPLTPLEHAQLHHMGERAFWALHKVDIESTIVRLNEEYNWMQKYKEKRP